MNEERRANIINLKVSPETQSLYNFLLKMLQDNIKWDKENICIMYKFLWKSPYKENDLMLIDADGDINIDSLSRVKKNGCSVL